MSTRGYSLVHTYHAKTSALEVSRQALEQVVHDACGVARQQHVAAVSQRRLCQHNVDTRTHIVAMLIRFQAHNKQPLVIAMQQILHVHTLVLYVDTCMSGVYH